MDLVNTYTNVGEAILDNMQLTTDYQRRGYHQVTLTEMDTTTIPQVAAGSMVEVGGSLYEADSNESISGSASSGTNYIYLVPGSSIVTPTWTTTAPTWSDAKQGWYGTGGSAGYRSIGQVEYDGASAYYKKAYLEKPLKEIFYSDSDNTERTTTSLTYTTDSNMELTFNTEIDEVWDIKFCGEFKAIDAYNGYYKVIATSGSPLLFLECNWFVDIAGNNDAIVASQETYEPYLLSGILVGTANESITLEIEFKTTVGGTAYMKNRLLYAKKIK